MSKKNAVAVTKKDGTLAPGKAKGRPFHVGQILQVLPGGSIVSTLVPVKLYRKIEKQVILCLQGTLSERHLCLEVMEILSRHVDGGGIIEVYGTYNTTTTDLRKYRILEILQLPAQMGPLSLVPGFTVETEYKLSMLTGKVRGMKQITYPNKKALEHKNPDRK
jgi:hypothetical protein